MSILELAFQIVLGCLVCLAGFAANPLLDTQYDPCLSGATIDAQGVLHCNQALALWCWGLKECHQHTMSLGEARSITYCSCGSLTTYEPKSDSDCAAVLVNLWGMGDQPGCVGGGDCSVEAVCNPTIPWPIEPTQTFECNCK